jgi:hypothetical protein
MKRFYLSLLLSLVGLSLSAQATTGNAVAEADTAKLKGTFTMKLPADLRYKLPDGSIIKSDKLDSAAAT